MSLWQMSLSGSVVIIVIVIIRSFLINRLPKRTFVLLWKLVLLRLLVPVSIPCVKGVCSHYNTNISVENIPIWKPISKLLTTHTGETVFLSVQNIQTLSEKNIIPWESIWFLGFLIFVAIYVICYGNCLRNFNTSLPVSTDYIQGWLKEHSIRRTISIRQYDCITSPLTYGILCPVILLPKSVDLNNRQQLDFIFKHELVHIIHFDLLTKMIASVTLCVHWFNPLVWALYILLNHDLELACDEAVISNFGKESRANYARTLIALEEHRSVSTILFSSFSKNIMKERIVAIMKPKKYTLWGVIGTLMLVVIVATSFFTSAQAAEQNNLLKDANIFTENASEEVLLEIDKGETEVSSPVSMTWPTESVTLSLTYGERIHPATGEIMTVDHICIKGEKGDDIYAAISGKVIETTFDVDRGNYLILANEDGIVTTYAHMQEISIAVGDMVYAGDVIGTLGASGKATGPNLAFGVSINGTPVNPMDYFE